MPTPAERQALLFVAAVAALGVGFRGFRALGDERQPAAAQVSLATQIRQVDSAITSAGVTRSRRAAETTEGHPRAVSGGRVPRAAEEDAKRAKDSKSANEDARGGEPVDLDVASVQELDRLPGIGPALAARIVADREANGPFGSLEQLQRVKGVGPALAAKLQPYVTFSLSPRLDLTEMPFE